MELGSRAFTIKVNGRLAELRTGAGFSSLARPSFSLRL